MFKSNLIKNIISNKRSDDVNFADETTPSIIDKSCQCESTFPSFARRFSKSRSRAASVPRKGDFDYPLMGDRTEYGTVDQNANDDCRNRRKRFSWLGRRLSRILNDDPAPSDHFKLTSRGGAAIRRNSDSFMDLSEIRDSDSAIRRKKEGDFCYRSDGAIDKQHLDNRRSARDGRDKPWQATSPKRDHTSSDDVIKEANRSSLPYHTDIEKAKWLAEQQIESSAVGRNFIPPRLVLISSNIKRRDHLLDAVKKDDNIICIPYDFNHSTFSGLIAEINTQLNRYKPGCKARSVLLFCQGGPGYLYMLKNKVLTREKLARPDNKDMAMFWRELGSVMSKVQPKESIIHIMGCFFLGNKQGRFVMSDIQDLMHPSVAVFEAPVEASFEGRNMVETYFDYKNYKAWKFQYQPQLTSYQLLRESFHWGEEDMLVAGLGTSVDKPAAAASNSRNIHQQRKSIHTMGCTVSDLKSTPKLRRENTMPSSSDS